MNKSINTINNNFDENNLNAIKRRLQNKDLTYVKEAYIMVLSNSPSNITVTEESREKFADILFS